MHARDLLVATSLLGMAGATVLACGDDDAVNPVPSDGGTDAAQATSDASSSARVTGRIVQAQSTTPLGETTWECPPIAVPACCPAVLHWTTKL